MVHLLQTILWTAGMTGSHLCAMIRTSLRLKGSYILKDCRGTQYSGFRASTKRFRGPECAFF
jgi:hypothetical protein